DAVRSAELERSLLLLSDTPGVEVKSTLKPGASVGATDLLVDVTPGPLLSGSVDADNYGNRYTGEYRLGGTLNVNSPLGLGDRLTL
ncbi:ShlB/FhaC/HecB family hemolysin secretion/activation protein, partial [Pseudomonas huaxiensis]